jgi:hypothetical protein
LRGVQFRINHKNINEYILLEINTLDEINVRVFTVPANIMHDLAKQKGEPAHNSNDNERSLTFKPNIIQKYLLTYRNKNIEKKIINGKYFISDFDMSKEYEF